MKRGTREHINALIQRITSHCQDIKIHSSDGGLTNCAIIGEQVLPITWLDHDHGNDHCDLYLGLSSKIIEIIHAVQENGYTIEFADGTARIQAHHDRQEEQKAARHQVH